MDFKSDIPIYKQLVNQIKIDILNNKYPCGSKIPSVREFAVELKINPNTVNRALLELENQGLIITKRTNGKFITEESKVITNLKLEYAKELTDSFKETMHSINISYEEIIKLIKGEKKWI